MTEKRPELTQELLKEYLDYNPETGIFTWIKSYHYRIKVGSVAGNSYGNNNSYTTIVLLKHRWYAHRLAWLYMFGELPPEMIDHVNGLRVDNRISNLRLATNTDNQRNKGLSSHNSSGVNGVYFNKGGSIKKWRASITIDKKTYALGSFLTFEEAVAAREKANKEHGFHENHGDADRPKYIHPSQMKNKSDSVK